MSGMLTRAAAAMDDAARRIAGGGRPEALDISLSVAAGPQGIPRTDVPAIATVASHFRISPTAADGIVELRLAEPGTLVMGVHGPGGPVAHGVDGTRLLLQSPKEGWLRVHTAHHSGPGRLLEQQADRLHVGDLAPVVVSGADTPPPLAHVTTGRPQPDVTTVLTNFDERGWQITESSAPRSRPDYVRRPDERVQSHFTMPRDTPLTLRADYTGQVDGKPAEGLRANLRRGTREGMATIAGWLFHKTEHLR